MSNRRVFAALLQTYLYYFMIRTFMEASPNDAYVENWHMRKIVWELSRCLRGETRRLILTMPPRSGKSIAASVAFVAYALGKNPKRRIITASYDERLAKQFANQTRRVMESPWYRGAFPRTCIDPHKNTEREIRTTAGGGRFATSTGSTLTGVGADIIIIDDPLNAVDAYSEAERKRADEWIRSGVMSRLNDKRNGVIIVVAQRLHDDDPVGRLIADESWHVVNFPAIAIEDQHVQIDDDEWIDWHAGDALQPEREPVEVLDRIRNEIGPHRFEAQYQQSPVPSGGNLIRAEWLQTYPAGSAPERDTFDRVVQSWDTASTLSETASYSVGTTWGALGSQIYLLDVFRARCEFTELLASVRGLARRYRPDVVLVEKAASGLQLLQTLRLEDRIYAVAVPAKHGKEARMEVQTPAFEAGRVLLPNEAPWLDAYRTELLGFPSTKYSDQVDSTSQALEYIGRRLQRSGARPRGFVRPEGRSASAPRAGSSGRITTMPFSDKFIFL